MHDAATDRLPLPRTGTERILRLALEKLEAFAPGRGRLCDLPCGTGFLAVEAEKAWARQRAAARR